MSGFLFPKWLNRAKPFVAAGLLTAPLYVGALFVYGANPAIYDLGYAPRQPVDYSHALHAGQLKMDCRFCHTQVENGATANVPPTQTCMNCHTNIKKTSVKLLPVRESHSDPGGKPVPWNKVHKLPDYVYFNHSAHVGRAYSGNPYGGQSGAKKEGAGIGCVSCHGRVDQMEVVHQVQPLSMGWCLECHRAPEKHLRPLAEVTNMEYVASRPDEGKELRDKYLKNVNHLQECWTCHR
jgi:hypothetical protein